MKKVFVSLFISLLFVGNIFAYNPTIKDEKIVQKIEITLEKLSENKLEKIKSNLEKVKTKFKNKDNQMSYLVGKIDKIVNKKLDLILLEKEEKLKQEKLAEEKKKEERIKKEEKKLDEKLEKLNNSILSEKELDNLVKNSFDIKKLTEEDKNTLQKEFDIRNKKISKMTDKELKEKEYELGTELKRYISTNSKEYFKLNIKYEEILGIKALNSKKNILDSIRGCYYLDNSISIRYTNINDCNNLTLEDIKVSYGVNDTGFNYKGGKFIARKYYYDKDNKNCYNFSQEGIKNYVNPNRYCKYEISIIKTQEENKRIAEERNKKALEEYEKLVNTELQLEIDRIKQKGNTDMYNSNLKLALNGVGRSSYAEEQKKQIQNSINREIQFARDNAKLKIDLFKIRLKNENTYVKGYYKNDGTYVPGYHRTNADNTQINNWSSKGNINPYTGKKGYK